MLTRPADPAEPFHRILLGLRWVALGLTVVMDAFRIRGATLPVVVVSSAVVMLLMTVASTLVSLRRPDLRASMAWVEVAVAAVLVVASPFALPPALRVPPLTGFWIASGPLTLLLAPRWGRGVVASAVLGVMTLYAQPGLSAYRIGLTLSLCTGGLALGLALEMIRAGVRERETMRVANAALAERQRLARIVHDGVLQVLAMVEREGTHLGPRGAMLARHAHEQEAQLRALIQETDINPETADQRDVTHRNFSVLLDRHASQMVSVATPVDPLLMESARAAELDAAVAEALTNAEKHAGPDSRAWVFLEIDGGEAIVSVRDNGVGGDPQVFAEAMRNGRMGMRHSIYGRIHDLGGTATLRTAPGRGVEWEFRVPIEL